MKITVLVDNNSRIDNYLLAEPALSFFIEYKSKKILFDTGYSNIFLKNAEKLGLSLENLTDIVISHGHNDHTGGLRYLPDDLHKVNLIAHPNIFDVKFDANNIAYGCPLSKAELENICTLNLTKNPFYNIFWLIGKINFWICTIIIFILSTIDFFSSPSEIF